MALSYHDKFENVSKLIRCSNNHDLTKQRLLLNEHSVTVCHERSSSTILFNALDVPRSLRIKSQGN